jgi:hypothetical protein
VGHRGFFWGGGGAGGFAGTYYPNSCILVTPQCTAGIVLKTTVLILLSLLLLIKESSLGAGGSRFEYRTGRYLTAGGRANNLVTPRRTYSTVHVAFHRTCYGTGMPLSTLFFC